MRKVKIVLEDPRSSFTAETGFRVADDKVSGLLQRRYPEDVGAGIAKGQLGFWTSLSAQRSGSPAVDKVTDSDGITLACNSRDLRG